MPVPALIWHDPRVSASLYETHVTVRCADTGESERLRRWAAAAGLKLTHIVPARGRMRDQPMLTLSGSRSFAVESAHARDILARLRADGFEAVRVKIESAPWAAEVPRRPCDGARYFEHHVKLRLTAGTDLAERHPLPHDLLLRVFRLSGSDTLEGRHRERITSADVSQAAGYVEWDHFVTEYPQFGGKEREYAERLVQALEPTFVTFPSSGRRPGRAASGGNVTTGPRGHRPLARAVPGRTAGVPTTRSVRRPAGPGRRRRRGGSSGTGCRGYGAPRPGGGR
jgi:hypothetical protein